MKCVICDKRKPKRYCPAKRASICPVCCGEKRGVEINCPLDCKYFVEGQKQHNKKVLKQRLRKEGAGSYVRRAELYSKNPEIFATIEKSIAHMFRSNKELCNTDLVTGLDLVLKTLETEKKGLLYEHKGESTYANDISHMMLSILDNYRNNNNLGSKIHNVDHAMQVVSEFLNEANFYAENDSNPKSYFIHILRYHPEEEAPSTSQSGLIITP